MRCRTSGFIGVFWFSFAFFLSNPWALGVESASSSASAAGSAASFKAELDRVAGASKEERKAKLAALDVQMDREVPANGTTDPASLYVKFHVKQQLGKLPEAAKAYADFMGKLEGRSELQEIADTLDDLGLETVGDTLRPAGTKGQENISALAIFQKDCSQWRRQRNLNLCSEVCDQMARKFSDKPGIASAALYHSAWSKYWMEGRTQESIDAAKKLIKEHPTSSWRPEAYRTLANDYYSLGRAKDALATLKQMEQEYPGTQWAHYANMRRASVVEYVQKEPLQALSIYSQSMKTYPDNVYAPYILKQVQRLKSQIEGNLVKEGTSDTQEH